MKLDLASILLLVVAKSGNAEFCGCGDLCENVWDTVATASDGSYSCGERINWLQTAMGFDEAGACAKVSSEFTDGPCGPVCDPTKCNAPSRCGCTSCTKDVLDSNAGGFSCENRINWVTENKGVSEEDACKLVGDEYPSICGMCHTDRCGSFPPGPTPPAPGPPSSGGKVKVLSYNTQYTGYADGRFSNYAGKRNIIPEREYMIN